MKKLSLPSIPLSNQQKTILLALGCFLLGGLITGGVAWIVDIQSHKTHPRPLRQSDILTTHSDYAFIDPLIALRGINPSPKYNTMQEQITTYIEKEKRNDLVSATVYFRDINEQSGFTLNPDELYTPASLYKVPVMMVYYKIAESNPSILSDMITYTGETDHSEVQEIKSSIQLIPGHRYTVEELIEHMIRYSDNNASHLLTDHLKTTNNVAEYATVFTDLGITLKDLSEYTDNITAGKYALFFRALYNATYLSREYSEHALKLLAETDFSEGLESGVPNDVPVAQKFGEVRMTDTEGTLLGKQLNTCGIVYYPNHPYLLCVMTKSRGNNIPHIEATVASISRMVYKNMQHLYP